MKTKRVIVLPYDRAWKADFDADAAGKLPADLKRGVLSEDGIDSVLERFRDLEERIG